MSFSLPTAFVNTYGTNVRHMAQQMNARLRMGVFVDTIGEGEAAYMEQMAPTAARRVVARGADSPLMNTQWMRRRITPFDYDWGDLVDRQDKLRLLVDPDSNMTRAGVQAMRRADDDEIWAAAFGTAYVGHNGTTAITWPNGDSTTTPAQPAGTQVAVNSWAYGNGSGNAGLTVSKVVEGRVGIMQAEGDEDEEIFIAVNGKEIGNMLATTEFTSSDYSEIQALRVRNFHGIQALGVTWLHSERGPVNTSGQKRILMWRRSALGLGVRQDIQAQGGPRPDKRYANYLYIDKSIGASRLEESQIAEIVSTV